jgi:beta-barrel assembly-enhancing protease
MALRREIAGPRGDTVQAPTPRLLAAVVVLMISTFSVAENRNIPNVNGAAMMPLTGRVMQLPGRAPVLIAPMVAAPQASPALSGRYSKAMQRLASKYDVAKIGERNVGKGMNFYSLEREMMLGRELSQQADEVVRLVQDPVITEYVNRLGQNLARNSDVKVPMIVKVVDSEEVNAYALPGGYFYVNTGLIMAADSEAELAAVMSHEIAHVAARHATHNMSKRNLFELCTLPTVFFVGPAAMALREVTQVALPLEFMKFSRDAEREADLLGMEYAYAAGYDPAAMVSFFEKTKATEKKKKGFIAKAFATHPMTDERVQRAQAEMETMLPPKDNYVVTTSEFDEVKDRVGRLVRNQMVAWVPKDGPTLRKKVQSPAPDGKPTLRKEIDMDPVDLPEPPKTTEQKKQEFVNHLWN